MTDKQIADYVRDVVDSMDMLGPDMSRARIRHAIEVLGGVSKKAAKRLEKEFQALNSARTEQSTED